MVTATPQLPELPTMDPAIHLLASDDRADGAVHALTLDAVLQHGGPAYWVDVRGYARTRPIAKLAPHDRVLERILVARGFTPWQHSELIDQLPHRAGNAALVVCPALDAVYREDDLQGDEGQAMLCQAIARLAAVAREHEVPVLVTRYNADEFALPIANAAGQTISYEQTPHGPRFEGDDFETLVYPTGDGTVQTTLAFWRRVLTQRAPQVASAGAPTPEVSIDG